MSIQPQQPAAPRTTRDTDAQLQLIRRYAKLLRESASAARGVSTRPGQRPASRFSSSASKSAVGEAPTSHEPSKELCHG